MIKKKEKIYCKDCVHHYYGDCMISPSIIYDPIDGEEYNYKECAIKNKNMHCIHYKQKPWWGRL